MYLAKAVSSVANSSMLFNVLMLSTLAYHVACHECYICGVGDSPYSCAEFDGSRKELCPHGVTSCSLQISGNDVIARSCGEASNLTDCKVANKIKYCYCAANLCNGATNVGIEIDDEDLAENGSGFEITTPTRLPSVETPTVKPKSNDSNSLRVTLFLFLYFFIFI